MSASRFDALCYITFTSSLSSNAFTHLHVAEIQGPGFGIGRDFVCGLLLDEAIRTHRLDSVKVHPTTQRMVAATNDSILMMLLNDVPKL